MVPFVPLIPCVAATGANARVSKLDCNLAWLRICSIIRDAISNRLVIEGYYTHSFPSMAMYLKYLGTKHHGRGVPAELYPSFCDALLSALEQFHGPDWNPRLAGQWQEAIHRASQAMLEGYREHFTV